METRPKKVNNNVYLFENYRLMGLVIGPNLSQVRYGSDNESSLVLH